MIVPLLGFFLPIFVDNNLVGKAGGHPGAANRPLRRLRAPRGEPPLPGAVPEQSRAQKGWSPWGKWLGNSCWGIIIILWGRNKAPFISEKGMDLGEVYELQRPEQPRRQRFPRRQTQNIVLERGSRPGMCGGPR